MNSKPTSTTLPVECSTISEETLARGGMNGTTFLLTIVSTISGLLCVSWMAQTHPMLAVLAFAASVAAGSQAGKIAGEEVRRKRKKFLEQTPQRTQLTQELYGNTRHLVLELADQCYELLIRHHRHARGFSVEREDFVALASSIHWLRTQAELLRPPPALNELNRHALLELGTVVDSIAELSEKLEEELEFEINAQN